MGDKETKTSRGSESYVELLKEISDGLHAVVNGVRILDQNNKSVNDIFALGAIPTIETEHNRIHNGDGYTCSGKFTVANAGSKDILLSNYHL